MTLMREDYQIYRETVANILGHNTFLFFAPMPGKDDWKLQVSQDKLNGAEHKIGQHFHVIERVQVGQSILLRLLPLQPQSELVN